MCQPILYQHVFAFIAAVCDSEASLAGSNGENSRGFVRPKLRLDIGNNNAWFLWEISHVLRM